MFLLMFVVLMHCIDIKLCRYLDNRKVCDKTLNKEKEEKILHTVRKD